MCFRSRYARILSFFSRVLTVLKQIQESILKQYDMALMTSPRCPTQFIGDHIMGSLVWSFYDQGDFVPIIRLMPYFEANCYCTVALDSTVQRGASGLNSEPLNATAISSIPHFLQLTCFDRFRAASVLAASHVTPALLSQLLSYIYPALWHLHIIYTTVTTWALLYNINVTVTTSALCICPARLKYDSSFGFRRG
ncbi:hypothetical protein C8R47DRAFT_453057 [Mycena vitilis]|nr:hypothetical protein C8R47DRAFT_453057 [Mycena vitilis]